MKHILKYSHGSSTECSCGATKIWSSIGIEQHSNPCDDPTHDPECRIISVDHDGIVKNHHHVRKVVVLGFGGMF